MNIVEHKLNKSNVEAITIGITCPHCNENNMQSFIKSDYKHKFIWCIYCGALMFEWKL